MKIQTSEAIILRHLAYGEADLIVTFLTPGQGILKGFARSARKSRKRFGPALEPFSRVELQWTEPRGGEMVSLREAELIDLHSGLRGDLVTLSLASYGMELVEGLVGEGQDFPGEFRLLAAFLDHLASGGSPSVARLLLELRLLQLTGYIPHLLHCSECNGSLGEGEAAFAADRGGSLCLSCAGGGAALRVAVGTLGTFSRCLRTPLEEFGGFRFGPRTLAEGEAMLAGALRLHLQRPLRTLPFLEQALAAGDGRKADKQGV